MQIQPQDLGARWHVAVVRYRALGTARINLPPRVGFLGRIWSWGSDVPEDVAAATLPLMIDQTGPLVAGFGTGVGLISLAVILLSAFQPDIALPTAGVAGALLYGGIVAVPRRSFRRLHDRPVRHEEIEALKGGKSKFGEGLVKRPSRGPIMKLFQSMKGSAARRPGDELENEFLTFVQDALTIQGISPTAEAEVRRVLRTIGETVAALPPADAPENEEVGDVLGDAEMLAARARREPDQIVADSLLRQADANVARARAMENNRKLRRRTQVLREEMLTQIRAVRSLLPSLVSDAATAATDFGRFATLAASVQSIASEANSVADAREELAVTLRPYTAAPQPEREPARLQQGTG
jgi:hypothetical protein